MNNIYCEKIKVEADLKQLRQTKNALKKQIQHIKEEEIPRVRKDYLKYLTEKEIEDVFVMQLKRYIIELEAQLNSVERDIAIKNKKWRELVSCIGETYHPTNVFA